MLDFESLLSAAAERHGHLCVGQVLGVRMAMAGLNELGVDPERDHKRLIVMIEIDRCAADAIAVVARVSLGKRTLKYVDYGKMAATFVDTKTGRAVRVVAREDSRERAQAYAPAGLEPMQAQFVAYRRMPDEELLTMQEVRVALSEFDLPGPPLRRVFCDRCGEGINDGREVVRDGETLCRSCAGASYYAVVGCAVPIANFVHEGAQL